MQPTSINGSGAVTSNYNGSQLSCATSTDGKITVSASGGTETLSYSIDGGLYGASNVFTNLAAGSHSLSVKDANGCTFAPASVTITAPSTVTVSEQTSSHINVLCYGGNNGSITVTATGGTAGYTYSNDNGANYQSSNVFNTLTAGTYSIKVKDANGCSSSTLSVTITQPTAVTSTFSTNNAWLYFGYSGDQSATITAKPSGGVGPYNVVITMDRSLIYNYVNSTGDEKWTASGGTTSGNTGPTSCSVSPFSPILGCYGSVPVTTFTGVTSVQSISVNVMLLKDAGFTVTVTDANGCAYSSSYLTGGSPTTTTSPGGRIDAEDVRCFAGNSNVQKVTICHRTGSTKNPCITLCVDENAVADHMAHGDYMGSCNTTCTAPTANAKQIVVEEEAIPFKVTAYPNPSRSQFTLLVEGGQNEKVEVLVYDMLARLIKRIEKTDGQPIQFGEELPRGEYLTIVKQGENMKAVNVIKQ